MTTKPSICVWGGFCKSGVYAGADSIPNRNTLLEGFADYLHYSIIVDLWRVEPPERVSSLNVRPGSLGESVVLGIVASTVTTWEHK